MHLHAISNLKMILLLADKGIVCNGKDKSFVCLHSESYLRAKDKM